MPPPGSHIRQLWAGTRAEVITLLRTLPAPDPIMSHTDTLCLGQPSTLKTMDPVQSLYYKQIHDEFIMRSDEDKTRSVARSGRVLMYSPRLRTLRETIRDRRKGGWSLSGV